MQVLKLLAAVFIFAFANMLNGAFLVNPQIGAGCGGIEIFAAAQLFIRYVRKIR